MRKFLCVQRTSDDRIPSIIRAEADNAIKALEKVVRGNNGRGVWTVYEEVIVKIVERKITEKVEFSFRDAV